MGEGGGGALKIKDQLGHVEETEGKAGGRNFCGAWEGQGCKTRGTDLL